MKRKKLFLALIVLDFLAIYWTVKFGSVYPLLFLYNPFPVYLRSECCNCNEIPHT